MPWSLGTPSLPYVDITCHILKLPSHMAPPAFPHLSPGSEIYLHLLVPELHRYLWKRHWAQLLGIGLGWEELEDHRESRLPPKGRGDRGQWRETTAPRWGVGRWGGGGVKLEEQGLGRSLEKGIPEKRVDVACSWGAKADGVGGLPR